MNTNKNSLTAWLTVTQAQSIGIRTVQKCLQHFESVDRLCHAQAATLSNIGLSEKQIFDLHHPNQHLIEQALRWQDADTKHHIVTFSDPRYPQLLREITQPPLLLYLHGNPNCLSDPQIAIVGSRKPSHNGLEFAYFFAHQLAQAGLTITSGLALGIDGAAHEGTLSTNGTTIAVLGTGLNCIYPKRHQSLAKRITEHGCLVSEFPLDSPPIPAHFPQRNRIISGLSIGTLVIEAAAKSGSLITARYATEQNREVFAMPGSLKNPAALGCLQLIQQGAKCITHIDDILEEINQLPFNLRQNTPPLNSNNSPSSDTNKLETIEQRVLACVDAENITTIDQICERSKLAPQVAMANLLALELAGHITARQGGYTKR